MGWLLTSSLSIFRSADALRFSPMQNFPRSCLGRTWRWIPNPVKKILVIFCQQIQLFIALLNSKIGYTYHQLFTEFTVHHPSLQGGFRNGGNSCYIASTLQCLIANQKFMEILHSIDTNSLQSLETETSARKDLRIKIIEKLRELIQDSECKRPVSSLKMNAFRKLLNEYSPDFIPLRQQDDSYSVCRIIFEVCQIPPIYYLTTYLHQIPELEVEGDTPKPEEKLLKHASILNVSFPSLSTESQKKVYKLEELLLNEENRLETTVSDYDHHHQLKKLPAGSATLQTLEIPFLDANNQLVEDVASNPEGEYKIPHFLTIQLKRFSQSRSIRKKIHYPVSASEVIEIYNASSLKKIKYQLTGVILHEGTLNEGHYSAYVRRMIDGKEQWVLCNDGYVGLSINSDYVQHKIARYGYMFTYVIQNPS